MKQSPLTDKTKQRGDIMLETLISMLLLTIIGLGLIYTISRVSVSQKDMNVHNLVVSKLRAELQAGNTTYNQPIVIGVDTFIIKPHDDEVSVEIGPEKIPVDVTMHSFSATKQSDPNYKICVGPASCD